METNTKHREIYTLGIWTVKPGKEAQFISEWTAFAERTAKNYPGAGKPYLLQDEHEPLRFISFGPWDNKETIRQWRESAEFRAFADKVKDLCDKFEPNTLKLVSTTNTTAQDK